MITRLHFVRNIILKRIISCMWFVSSCLQSLCLILMTHRQQAQMSPNSGRENYSHNSVKKKKELQILIFLKNKNLKRETSQKENLS